MNTRQRDESLLDLLEKLSRQEAKILERKREVALAGEIALSRTWHKIHKDLQRVRNAIEEELFGDLLGPA